MATASRKKQPAIRSASRRRLLPHYRASKRDHPRDREFRDGRHARALENRRPAAAFGGRDSLDHSNQAASRDCFGTPGVTPTDGATAARLPRGCSTLAPPTGRSALPLARFTPGASRRAAVSPPSTRLLVLVLVQGSSPAGRRSHELRTSSALLFSGRRSLTSLADSRASERAPGWRRVRPNFVLPRLPHCTTTSGAGDGGRVIATAALRRPAADAGCTKGVVRRHDDQRDGAAASHHNQACRRRPPKCTLRDGNAQGRPRASTAYASVGAAAPVVPTADGQARHSRHA